MSTQWHLRCAAAALRAGGIVAYPTEAVFGLGCDPSNALALERLLAAKGRPESKGFILIASSFEQLRQYLAELEPEPLARVNASWPGPVTWLWPARPEVTPLLTGGGECLAVRVTAHPLAAALCDAFGGAIVSTSANPSGLPPARTALGVQRMLGARVDFILHGELGKLAGPTEIRDARSGAVIRPATPRPSH